MKFLRLKKAEVLQPNKPKPTTMLPDNMEWSWDPEAMDWVAVLKDNTNVTPPLYNPNNNQTITNNTTSYMSNVKTASSDKYEYMLLDRLIQDAKYFIKHPDLKHLWAKTLDEHIAKMKEQYTKLDPKPEWTSEDSIDELAKKMKEVYSNHWNEVHPDNKIESSLTNCLAEFLDGPRYSKEIKIEAGLIKNGLVKYAGFDFNKGTKYIITDKGLEVLRKASEKEHNEALNEREKLAYMFGFNTDKETTLDTTGKVIKSDKKFHIHLPGSFYTQEIYGETIDDALENYGYKKDEIVEWYDDEGNGEYIGNLVECDLCGEKYEADELVSTDMGNVCFKCKKGIESKEGPFQKRFSITEADGTPLGKVTASSELDAKVKFGIEHPEYAESLSICAKEIKSAKQSCIYVYNINWNDERHKYMDDNNQLPLLPKSETLYESDFPHDFEWEHIEEVPDYIMKDAIDDILYKMHEVQPHSFEYEIKTGNKEIKADNLFDKNHKDPKLGITIGEEERLIKQVAKDYEISEEMAEFIFGGLRGFSKDWKLNEQHIEIVAKNTFLRPIDIELIAKDFGFKVDENKKVESQYEQTTNTKEPYPNPSETPHDDIVLENHEGWVNTASEEDGYTLPSTYLDNNLTQYHIEKFPSGKWYYWFNSPYSKRREQVGPYNTHDEAVEFLKKHHGDVSSPYEEAVQLLKKHK